MSVNEKMTAIADAIREKTGESEPLSLDEMAEAIAGLSISTGSAETGTVTASGSATISISHSLGKVPLLVMIYSTSSSVASKVVKICGYNGTNGNDKFGIANTSSNNNLASYGIANPSKYTVNASKVSFTMTNYTFDGDYSYILGAVS